MKKTIALLACTVMVVLPAVVNAATEAVANASGHETAAMVLAGLMIMATIVRRRSNR